MKSVDVKSNTYINSIKKINDKDPKFKVGNHVRTSKYKSIYAKGYVPNWSEEVFVIKEHKNTVLWTCVIIDLNREIVGTFSKKKYKKEITKSLELKK